MKRTDRGRGGVAGADPDDALREYSQSLPMLLLRGHQAVMAQFRPLLREHGVTDQQWRVLRALASVDETRITRLAQMTLISKPSLSRLLPGLEARGLVRRSPAADDLRGASVRISAAGRTLLRTVGPHSEARYRAIGERIGERAMAALHEALPRLARELERPLDLPSKTRAPRRPRARSDAAARSPERARAA